MIILNKKTEQDFLSKKWMKMIEEAYGKPITDNKYVILTYDGTDYVALKSEYLELDKLDRFNGSHVTVTPTYTLSELLYKLPEWPGQNYKGLSFFKDAPFYSFGYYGGRDKEDEEEKKKYIVEMPYDYPIESAAALLIYCYKDEETRRWIPSDISDK